MLTLLWNVSALRRRLVVPDMLFVAVVYPVAGLDGAGKVVKTGTGVKDLQKGDQFMFLSLDSSAFATHKKTTQRTRITNAKSGGVIPRPKQFAGREVR